MTGNLMKEEIKTQTYSEGWSCENTGDSDHLQVMERGLKNQHCRYLDLGPPEL